MLSQDERRRLDDIERHLRRDPIFTVRMRSAAPVPSLPTAVVWFLAILIAPIVAISSGIAAVALIAALAVAAVAMAAVRSRTQRHRFPRR